MTGSNPERTPHRQDHDPLLHATNVTCRTCGAESFPTNAEWITGTLLLASYEAGCERGCPWRGFPGVVLLDLGQDDMGIPAVERPRRCRGTSRATGRQCRSYARPGSGYCYRHGPDRQGAA